MVGAVVALQTASLIINEGGEYQVRGELKLQQIPIDLFH